MSSVKVIFLGVSFGVVYDEINGLLRSVHLLGRMRRPHASHERFGCTRNRSRHVVREGLH